MNRDKKGVLISLFRFVESKHFIPYKKIVIGLMGESGYITQAKYRLCKTAKIDNGLPVFKYRLDGRSIKNMVKKPKIEEISANLSS